MNSKKSYIIKSVICDFIVFALVLAVFCYFHHIKRLTDDDDGGDIIINRPGADTEDGDGTDGVTDETGGEPGGTSDEGDFGASFSDVFAEEGIVDAGADYYRSHDIYFTVKTIFEPRDDYYAYYIVYDVYVRNLENIFAIASVSSTPFDELVEKSGAVAAISGDYWLNNSQFCVRNGIELLREDYLENDVCVMFDDGTMEIVTPAKYTKGYLDSKRDSIYQVWDFGPSLLDGNGKSFDSFDDYSDISGRNPRSSIGYCEPGHYVFIVCEGRRDVEFEGITTYTKGVRLPDLSDIYEELGVKIAYNLDGGDSAFAYYNGKVLRYDLDRELNGEEQREIYDIICIGEVTGDK